MIGQGLRIERIMASLSGLEKTLRCVFVNRQEGLDSANNRRCLERDPPGHAGRSAWFRGSNPTPRDGREWAIPGPLRPLLAAAYPWRYRCSVINTFLALITVSVGGRQKTSLERAGESLVGPRRNLNSALFCLGWQRRFSQGILSRD